MTKSMENRAGEKLNQSYILAESGYGVPEAISGPGLLECPECARAPVYPRKASRRLVNERDSTGADRKVWLVITHGDCNLGPNRNSYPHV